MFDLCSISNSKNILKFNEITEYLMLNVNKALWVLFFKLMEKIII